MNDALLVELKENQMSKESMRSVKGGSAQADWDTQWEACTPTGVMRHYIDDDGIHHLYVDGDKVLPSSLPANDNRILHLADCDL